MNKMPIEVEEGITLLNAARDIGIEVPTLCYWEGVTPMNSCMLCVMRNTKTGLLVPSCSTVAQDGMEIETDSGDVCNSRKAVLELTVSEHVGDCEAPCSHTCPASMNIPIMMRQIYEGDFDNAAYTVTNGLVFPWTLGYVCPAPCENPCRRKGYDTTMEIRELHKTVAEKAHNDNPELFESPPDTGKKVAVVGGGLTGMSAAWVLRKEGHACTVYEKDPKAGGKWRNSTPEDLPDGILDAEIGKIEELGVHFEYDHEVNNNGMLEELQANYDAVIIACKHPAKPGGKIFEAKEHKMAVKAVGNGKTTALWVDRYMKSVDPDANKKLFDSKIGRMDKPLLEILRVHNENQEIMAVEPVQGNLSDSQKEAGRCLHCDCRKQKTCGLRKWSTEYGVETKKYNTTEELDFRILGKGEITFEPGKCIRCGLCVKIAEKYDEDIGLAFIGRGFEMIIKVPFDHSFDKALTNSADECVVACPTAAIAFRDREDVEECHTTAWIEV